MTITSKFDFSGAEKIIKQAKKKYATQVGVLSSDDARIDGLSNATIGMEHEFGVVSKNIPARSFLRMPLNTHGQELMSVLKGKMVKKSFEKNNIKHIFELIGIKAEAIVQDAFSTAGFGQWASNSELTIKLKGSDTPLIDTGELRKSIHSRVVTK